MRPKTSVVLCLASLALAPGGCAGRSPEVLESAGAHAHFPSAPASLPESRHAARWPLDGVTAVVNSTVVTWSDLRARSSCGREADAVAPALDALILEVLLDDEAARAGIAVSAEEIDRALEGIRRSLGDDASFEAALRHECLTAAEHRELVRKHLIKLKLVALRVRSRIPTGDDVLRAYYRELGSSVAESSLAPYEDVKDALLEHYLERETERRSRLWFDELKERAYIDIK